MDINGIGIRVFSGKEVNFCIVTQKTDGSFDGPYLSKVIVPLALDLPEQLNFIRSTVLDILLEYKVNCAGIRIAETQDQKLRIDRISIEAVVQEALAGSEVEKYIACRIGTFKRLLGLGKGQFNELVDGTRNLDAIPDWKSLNPIKRECVLACLASFELLNI